MKPKSEKAKKALRDSALSLTKHCPVDGTNPDDCPLHGVRQLGPVRSCQWIHDLTTDDLSYLNAYHAICERIRMESRGGQDPPPPAPRLYAVGNKDELKKEGGSQEIAGGAGEAGIS
jgi:hypothetical protein